MAVIQRLPTIGVSDVRSRNGYPAFSEKEMLRRHAWIGEVMAKHDLDVVLIGGASGGLETTVQYFTNWPPLVESFVVVGGTGPSTLFVRLWNHIPDAELISWIQDVRYGGDTSAEQVQNVASLMVQRGWSKARIGWLGGISAGSMLGLREVLDGAIWVDLRSEYSRFRLVKSEEELAFMRIASTFNDAAVGAMKAGIRQGMREYEIARVIEDTYLDQRASNMIHFVMSTPMDAPVRSVPHQFHPDRVIEHGDVVVTEISTNFWGYAGQILRSFTVGCEPTAKYQELFDVATEAYTRILGVLKAGTTVGAILDAADFIENSGFTILDDLVHGQGGAYLPPIVRTRANRGATSADDFAYPENAVIVVQPNVVTTNFTAGVQLGNAVHLTETGVEVLQEYPMEFIRCD